MERDFGVAGRLLGLGVLDNLLPLLWETQPERFPLTGTVLDLATRPDRPLALRRATARARPATAGRSGGSRTRPGRARTSSRRRRRRRPADRLLRLPEHEQADPAAPRGVRARCASAAPARGCCSSAQPAERFDLDRRLERLGHRRRRRDPRATTSPRSGSWSLMAACDVLVNLRSPTMGETSGSVIRGALARQADARLGRRLVRRASRRRRAEDPGRRVRGADDRRGARARRRARGASSAPRRARTCGASTTSARVADAYAAALEEAAGGDAVDDAVLRRIAEAAAEIGIDDAAELARLAREVGLG